MIDAHVHFWRRDRGEYPWLTPDLVAIDRDFAPEDLAEAAEGSGVTGALVVQAAQTEAETAYLLGLAQACPLIRGVIGWVDLAAPDGAQAVARVAAAGGAMLRGVRAPLEGADAAWVAAPAHDAAFAALREHGLVLEALVTHDQLAAIAARMDRTPGLTVVIDHAARPPAAAAARPAWRAALGEVARRGGACKFSGLLDQLAAEDVADARGVLQTLLELFGAERVMWGSDWPVLRLVGSYDGWRAMSEAAMAGLSAGEVAALRQRAAEAVYRLGPPRTEG